jgi:hypothetical protein
MKKKRVPRKLKKLNRKKLAKFADFFSKSVLESK